jgi:hypothetical protein
MRVPLRPIGVVRSPVVAGRDDGWGQVTAELHLDPEQAPGLQGVERPPVVPCEKPAGDDCVDLDPSLYSWSQFQHFY